MSITLTELLWTQAWSGVPIYLLAAVGQALWLHHRSDFGPAALVAIAVFSTGLAILAGVVIWGRVFGPVDIMLYGMINIPAVIASLILFPVVGWLCLTGFRD